MSEKMSKIATLYRMEVGDHICPFGLRAKDLLNRKGFQVVDKVLKTREAVEEIKNELGVKTTPQIIIDNNRVGGFDDLKHYLNPHEEEDQKSYFPVLSLFVVAALTSVAFNIGLQSGASVGTLLMNFIGVSMIMLGLLKLQDLDSFVNGFLAYDLLARKYVPYAFLYPFAEVSAGILMLANMLPFASIPLMLFIGGIGGVSVFKAVYIDKRELKCACVGGNSNVPLGLVSFTENAVMLGAGIYMLFAYSV